jgi:acyl carrier protein
LQDPAEKTATRYRSGDIARWLASGELEFLGRSDDQVKIRGYRIELGEIETALLTHASVRGAAARIWLGPDADPRLLAYVVPEPNAEIVFADLREHLQKSLPPYMLPQHFMLIDELPKTSSGKLDRRALPEFSPDALASERERVEPTNDEELKLAEIWTQMLGIQRPGVTEDFFDVGGHSLLAVRMLTRIREVFGVQMSLQALIEKPTIAALAERIQAWAFVNLTSSAAPAAEREESEF